LVEVTGKDVGTSQGDLFFERQVNIPLGALLFSRIVLTRIGGFSYLAICKLYRLFNLVSRELRWQRKNDLGYYQADLGEHIFKKLEAELLNYSDFSNISAVDESNPIIERPVLGNLGEKLFSIIDHKSELRKFIRQELGWGYVFTRCSLIYSPNTHSISASSQEFHFDWQGRNTVKIFVNMHEMKNENGPLQWLSYKDSANFRKSDMSIQYKGGKRRFAEADLGEGMNVFSNLGNAGMLSAINTEKCMQRGSRKSKEPRLCLFFEFYSFLNYEPKYVMKVVGRENGAKN
jgi:hypothetical protein